CRNIDRDPNPLPMLALAPANPDAAHHDEAAHSDRVACSRTRRAGFHHWSGPVCSALDRRGIVQARILAAHRISDGVLQAAGTFPFAWRPDLAIAADLVDSPIDLQPVIVEIAKFDGYLAAGATPAGEVDLHSVPAQMP